MAYKSILTILTNPDTAELAITAAARLAQAQDAHLDVLVLGVDRTQVGYSYIGTGAVLMQVALDRAEADARGLIAGDEWPALATSEPGEARLDERPDLKAAGQRMAASEAERDLARASRTRWPSPPDNRAPPSPR